MGDYGSDDGLVGFVTTVVTVISEIAKYDSDSTRCHYDSVNRANELRYMAKRDEYEYDLEEERISAQAARMEQKLADEHEEEIARIDAARMQAANTHEEEMEKIAVLERLKTQENELRRLQIFEETKRFMSLLDAATKISEKKMEYFMMLAKNTQEYFMPLQAKLLTLIDRQRVDSAKLSGREFEASLKLLDSLEEGLHNCTSEYKKVMFDLTREVNKLKIEMIPMHSRGGMIEDARY